MSKAKKNLSKSQPTAPQKPAVKTPEKPATETTAAKEHPFVSAFFPDERKKMIDELTDILMRAMPQSRNADPILRKWFETINRHMKETTRYFDIDDIGICIGAYREIREVSDSLNTLLETLDKLPGESAESKFAALLRPAVHWLDSLVSNDLSCDVDRIRQNLIDRGYGGHIRG